MEFKLLDTLDRKAGLKRHQGSMMMMSPGQPAFTDRNYNKIAKEGYMKNPFVYSAVDFGSNTFSNVGLKLERELSDGSTEEIDDHELLDRLENPNDDDPGLMFRKQIYSFFKLSGKCFTHKLSPDTGPNAGKPRQLVNWVPGGVEVLKGDDNLISGYKLKDEGTEFDKDEVIYIKDFHPTNTANGHPAAISAARAVDVSNAQLEWNKSILDNRGVPAHVFRGSWTQSEAKKWRQKNEREMSGKFKAGRDMYLPDSVDVDRLGFDTQELDWLGGLKAMARIIYASYNMPSELFNDGENKTYSNFEQAIKAILLFDTIPTWNIVISYWNKDLVPDFEEEDETLKLSVDKDSIEALSDDMMEKTEQAIMMYEGNIANKGEARKVAGMDDDVDDADRTILRSNFIPEGDDVGSDVDEDEFTNEEE